MTVVNWWEISPGWEPEVVSEGYRMMLGHRIPPSVAQAAAHQHHVCTTGAD